MFDLMVLVQIPSFRAARVVFRVLLPDGLIAAFPTEVFLGGAGALPWLEAVPVVAVFTFLSGLAWRRALAGYASTGT